MIETVHQSEVEVIALEPRAVSAETAARMFEWKTSRFTKWAKQYGLRTVPGSNRYLVCEIDAAIQRWRRTDASTMPEPIKNDGLGDYDEFDRATLRRGGAMKYGGNSI